MQSCMRRIKFSYGHRLLGADNKCCSLHGHNAVVEIYAASLGGLDAAGMIINFDALKAEIGGWIDEHWDHTTILSREDEATIQALQQAPRVKALYLLDGNPTAEMLARHLLLDICPKLLKGRGAFVYKVAFWETESCCAEETLDSADPEVGRLYGENSKDY